MSAQEVEEDLAEGDLLFFARHHVGHVIHSDPHREFLSPSSNGLVVRGPVMMSSPA